MPRPSTGANEKTLGQTLIESFDKDSGALYVMPIDIAIRDGMFPDMSKVHKFGHAHDVDTGDVPEDVWTNGGVYGFLTAATILTISSEATTDNSAGTGARTAQVIGLDTDYNALNVDVTMDGQTEVNIGSTPFLRVRIVKVLTAGDSGTNDATIYVGYSTVAAGIPSQQLALVDPDEGQTLMAIDTVPAGKNAYLVGVGGSINGVSGANSREADFELMAREEGGAWQVKSHWGINSNGNNPAELFDGAIPQEAIPEKSDIRIRVKDVTNDDTEVSAWFSMVLRDN